MWSWSRSPGMLAAVAACIAVLAGGAAAQQQGVCPRIVPREEWGAALPKQVVEMVNPVNTVVIHHTATPAYCATPAECIRAVKSVQEFHQGGERGWDDIGYNFAVGGDGRVYKGRGWNRVGAHSPPYNADSIGITLIGDYSTEAPPQLMLDTAQWLIRCGVDTGRIAKDYQLIGHRQSRPTACPGDGLFNVVKTWEHWVESPAPPARHPPASAASTQHQHHHQVAVAAAAEPPTATPEPQTPAAAAGLYDPLSPDAERDAVEVRPLNKRSLWDRLFVIWQKEAMRQAAIARQEERALQEDLQQDLQQAAS